MVVLLSPHIEESRVFVGEREKKKRDATMGTGWVGAFLMSYLSPTIQVSLRPGDWFCMYVIVSSPSSTDS